MCKPTVAFTCVGLVMLKPGWLSRYPPRVTSATVLQANTVYARRPFVRRVGVVYAGATLGIAVLNAPFAMYASQKGWALFNAAGPAEVYTILRRVLFIGGRLSKRDRGALTPANS